MTTAARILVTDAQDRPGIEAIRSLRAAGFRPSAVGLAWWAPGLWSRYCSSRSVVPDPHDGVDEYVAGLERIVRRRPHDVLLHGTDETLFAVSSRRERLSPYVPLGLPAPEVVARALSKESLARAAAEAGLPTPDGVVCDDHDEALAAAREFGFPVLVKGVDTITERDGRLVRYPTQFAQNEDELATAQHRIGRCIVQRRMEGHVSAFLGVATDDGLLGMVLNRYRRTWPPVAGMASFSETAAIPSSLAERVGALVDSLGWRGIFQLQMIEGADGTMRPIDFNPRMFGSMGIARAAGVPLATLWSQWLLGERPSPAVGRPGVTYRWEQGDARNIVWQLRNGDVRGALTSVRPVPGTMHPYLQASDPLVLLAQCGELVAVRFQNARKQRVDE
jgi:predicted ATP-grasp superfamily ATP-dependent carboligase